MAGIKSIKGIFGHEPRPITAEEVRAIRTDESGDISYEPGRVEMLAARARAKAAEVLGAALRKSQPALKKSRPRWRGVALSVVVTAALIAAGVNMATSTETYSPGSAPYKALSTVVSKVARKTDTATGLYFGAAVSDSNTAEARIGSIASAAIQAYRRDSTYGCAERGLYCRELDANRAIDQGIGVPGFVQRMLMPYKDQMQRIGTLNEYEKLVNNLFYEIEALVVLALMALYARFKIKEIKLSRSYLARQAAAPREPEIREGGANPFGEYAARPGSRISPEEWERAYGKK